MLLCYGVRPVNLLYILVTTNRLSLYITVVYMSQKLCVDSSLDWLLDGWMVWFARFHIRGRRSTTEPLTQHPPPSPSSPSLFLFLSLSLSLSLFLLALSLSQLSIFLCFSFIYSPYAYTIKNRNIMTILFCCLLKAIWFIFCFIVVLFVQHLYKPLNSSLMQKFSCFYN